MYTSWRETVKGEWAPQIVNHPKFQILDVLEEVLRGDLQMVTANDKYVFMGRLLDEGKKRGLLTVTEYYNLREAIAGSGGWL